MGRGSGCGGSAAVRGWSPHDPQSAFARWSFHGADESVAVDDGVMSAAEQGEFVEVGVATGLPRIQVMGFAPTRWPIAAGEGAALVPLGEGGSLSGVARRDARPTSRG